MALAILNCDADSKDPLCLQDCKVDPIDMKEIPRDEVIRLMVNRKLQCYRLWNLYRHLSNVNSEPTTQIRFSQYQLNRITALYRERYNPEAPALGDSRRYSLDYFDAFIVRTRRVAERDRLHREFHRFQTSGEGAHDYPWEQSFLAWLVQERNLRLNLTYSLEHFRDFIATTGRFADRERLYREFARFRTTGPGLRDYEWEQDFMAYRAARLAREGAADRI